MTQDWHLPDPHYQPAFYADVPLKRLLAFAIDTVILLLATLLLALISFGLVLIFLLPVWWLLNFAYRAVTLANGSATPGMRLLAIEFRTADGRRFDQTAALLHTAGFMLSFTFFPVQVVSMILMVTSPRAQGLTDHVLGSVAINRRAQG